MRLVLRVYVVREPYDVLEQRHDVRVVVALANERIEHDGGETETGGEKLDHLAPRQWIDERGVGDGQLAEDALRR